MYWTYTVCDCGISGGVELVGWGWLGGGDTYVPCSGFIILPQLWHLLLLYTPPPPPPNPTHTYIDIRAHTLSPPNPASCMCPPLPYKPLLDLLLSCPLFSSWWQNEFAYLSQGALIRMHKPAASEPHDRAPAFCLPWHLLVQKWDTDRQHHRQTCGLSLGCDWHLESVHPSHS